MIKMFEEYNNKNWTKVTKSEFTSCADHYGDENFTDEELKKVKKILYASYFPIKKNIIVAKKLLYDHDHYYFLIRKHRDEWFTVYFTIYDDNSDNKNNEYYICDQFYSVIDVINHIISDKNINESFDLKNINDWQEITNDHHNEFDMKYHYDEFSDEEYSNIIKLFTDVRVKKIYDGFNHQIGITSNSFFSLHNDDYFSMNITKYQDDWYIVYYYHYDNNPTYYLCDQFYNMIKCIKHLVSSNISDNINESYSYHEVIPNRYVYHTSNPHFRDKILKWGLVPKGKSESWLSDTKIGGKVIFVVNSNDEYVWDSTYDDDVYRIDTNGLGNKWYNDPNFGRDGIHLITFDSIPVSAIELVYSGSGNCNESYSEVTFNDVVNRVLVGFNEMELNQIFGHVKGLGINIYKSSPYALMFIVGTIRFEILKLEDEWFILEQSPNKYYKCDQIYGLLKCLDEVLGFSKFNESNDVSGYYYKLNSHPALSDEMPLYDKDKLEYLRKYLLVRYGNRYQSIKFHKSGYSWDFGDDIYDCVRLMNDNEFIRLNDIEVYIYDDGWHIVECLDTSINDILYYKCDQIDGLVKFLDDHMVPKFRLSNKNK